MINHLFLSVFAMIFVAELPDKMAFASLLMATRQSPWSVFLGACLAFVVQSIVAVSFGSLFGLLPIKVVHITTGVLFLVFGWIMWRREQEYEESEASSVSIGWACSSYFLPFILNDTED